MSSFKRDPENIEFNQAFEFISKTNKNLFLTGKAGTGKTTFLKHIKEVTNKNMVVVAPTGVAAINAGGNTLHSFFQLPFGPLPPNDHRLQTIKYPKGENKRNIYETFRYNKEKKKLIYNLDLLVIDEISMVRADLLDAIDKLLRIFRKKPHYPFGGVQVLLIGDVHQLPPIARPEEWKLLNSFYQSPFFFHSQVMQEYPPIHIELQKIYRQKDQTYIDLLNKVRNDDMEQSDFELLNSKYDPHFEQKPMDEYITLSSHNRFVNQVNNDNLAQLKTPAHKYKASVIGKFDARNASADEVLVLKEEAQVMFLKNDTGEDKRFFNGKIGRVKELTDTKIIVTLDGDTDIKVEKHEWSNVKYVWNEENQKIEEEIIGTFSQYPLKLAWAITVHKSQGLTFEHVIADLSQSFSPGQVYVALSRCTSFEGLILQSPIWQNAIKTAPEVLEFSQQLTNEEVLRKEFINGQADHLYGEARKAFAQKEFGKAYQFVIEALDYRNDLKSPEFKRFVEIHLKRLDTSGKSIKKKPLINIDSSENASPEEKKQLLEKMERDFYKLTKDDLLEGLPF